MGSLARVSQDPRVTPPLAAHTHPLVSKRSPTGFPRSFFIAGRGRAYRSSLMPQKWSSIFFLRHDFMFTHTSFLPYRARPMPLPRQSSILPLGVAPALRREHGGERQPSPLQELSSAPSCKAGRKTTLIIRSTTVRTVTGFDPSSTRFPTLRTGNILFGRRKLGGGCRVGVNWLFFAKTMCAHVLPFQESDTQSPQFQRSLGLFLLLCVLP